MYCIKVHINKLSTSMYSYSMTGAYCEIVIAIYTVSAKTDHVCTKTEITFIAQEHSYTQELVSPLSNVSGSAFLEGIC